ncbi:MAG: hypothetical protein HY514_03945, partial [Candidatus Aenigmarchaeota archaeon]|nr:hypothetical protein [Candidatus Aenigmarchaeota archaeon]
MNKYILLSIALLVAVAGCIGTRPATQNPLRGVTISTFTATDSQVRSGEFVLFDLEVENIGGTTARNVQADLFGVEGQWKDTFGNLVQDTQTKQLSTLKPPLPERNIAGDLKLVQWQLQTPTIPQGISPNLQVEARVTYDYNTSGHLLVGAMSEDEFRRRQINNQPPGFTAESVNSQGPIHLEINEKFKRPLIVDTTTSETTSVHPFRFEFVNVGDGFPITPEDDGRIRGAGGKLSGTIEVFGPGVSFDDCLGQRSGTRVDLDNAEITVRLRETNRVPVACSIKIDKTTWGNRPEDTVQFVFNIFYRY